MFHLAIRLCCALQLWLLAFSNLWRYFAVSRNLNDTSNLSGTSVMHGVACGGAPSLVGQKLCSGRDQLWLCFENHECTGRATRVKPNNCRNVDPRASHVYHVFIDHVIDFNRASRHHRIFADHGTDFNWRDPDDLMPEKQDCMLEAEEVLSAFPVSVLELYDAWVDTYTNNFRERRDKSQNYLATIFPSASEEVALTWLGFCWLGAL